MSILRPVAPITKGDLKRAAFWGLRIPPPATVVEVEPIDPTPLVLTVAAPAFPPAIKTTGPRPADVREMASWLAFVETAPCPDEDGDEEGDPSSWPSWTDADRWELGSDTDPAESDELAAVAGS